MLPYVFSPVLFVRCPALPVPDFKNAYDFHFLRNESFRRALYFASPDLYHQVKLQNFDPKLIKPGARDSLLKYYNRMCYRATPFGLFSSFSSIAWGNEPEPLTFTGKNTEHIDLDFKLAKEIIDECFGEELVEPFHFNASSYRVGKELRYLKTLPQTSKDSGSYGIAAVGYNKLLKELKTLTRYGTSLSELRDFFLRKFPEDEPDEILLEFTAEELILSSTLPNVTGEKYLGRISTQTGNLRIRDIVNSLRLLNAPHTDCFYKAADTLKSALGDIKTTDRFYVNYTRSVNGTLNESFQVKLLDAIACLYRLHDNNESSFLSKFRIRFSEKFEKQEIPLMSALDPEIGISYAGLEGNSGEEELLGDINFNKPPGPDRITWGAVQSMLVTKMTKPRNDPTIIITDDDLRKLPENTTAFASGISVMFRIHDDKVFIEAAGGAGATSLIGRFTAFDEKILKEAKQINKIEQEANDSVIFAEIAYFTDEHAANINVRGHVCDYEIPVMVNSTLDSAHVIRLDELMISVRGNELILRSSRLNKRVIPRMSSAYNHGRSELPVFRFLSDLQHQTVGKSLTLNPEEVIPGLSYYPRIEYKDTILSQATWIFTDAELSRLTDGQSFIKIALERSFPRYFALSEGDKQLVFDLQSTESIQLLLRDIKKRDKVTFKEFFMPSNSDAGIKDGENEIHISQYIACLTNPQKVYAGLAASKPLKSTQDRVFFPGSKWIYLKIYCSDQATNHIISRKIYPFIKRNAADIHKWFFIRYNDPDHHLRVRILGKLEFVKNVSEQFNTILRPLGISTVISNMQIDSYKPEIERYGVKTIGQVEKVFQASSLLIAERLSRQPDAEMLIEFGVIGLREIFNAFKMDLDRRITLLEAASKSLMAENGDEKTLRADLNKKYRVFQRHVNMAFNNNPTVGKEKRALNQFKMELELLYEQVRGHAILIQDQLALDIFHMHMNRLFNTEQRKNEMVIYYLCLRHYMSVKARFNVKRQ